MFSGGQDDQRVALSLPPLLRQARHGIDTSSPKFGTTRSVPNWNEIGTRILLVLFRRQMDFQRKNSLFCTNAFTHCRP
jgi:hypothetical protein